MNAYQTPGGSVIYLSPPKGTMPDYIVIDPEYFGLANAGAPVLSCLVLATFRDCAGATWIAFDVADMHGVYVIETNSKFFKGFEQ